MAVSRQLDLACASALPRRLILPAAMLLLILPWQALGAQLASTDDAVGEVRQLFAGHKWEQIVRRVEREPGASAELNYYYGLALAQLGRLDGARQALLRGYRQQAGDKRFPIELAGVEFKQKEYARAAEWLQRALKLDAEDEYANDFLGSVYFLQGNLEAALKYWNVIGKPRIEQVRIAPEPLANPALLDSAFAFSPASTLRLPELLSSRARVEGLEIFTRPAFELSAHPNGNFDLTLRAYERNGWGGTRWEGLRNLLRGVFLQTVYPEYYNISQSAVNAASLVRWDKEKRRLAAAISGPLRQNASRRYRVAVDLRNENWDIRRSSRGPAPVLGSLNLRKDSFSASLTSFAGARWRWSTGAELSRRNYRSVFAGTALTPEMLQEGYQLKHTAEINHELWRVPERRLTMAVSGTSELGRIWSQPSHAFAKLQGGAALHWLPQAQGSDYQVRARFRGGKTFSKVPFDELFMLGLERDNQLWMRAHIGSRDGRKGSAPLGRSYFLANWEIDKVVYDAGLISFRLSPFLDAGKMFEPSTGPPSGRWLWDIGVQSKMQVLGVGVVFTYGKDLRSGANVFYVALGG